MGQLLALTRKEFQLQARRPLGLLHRLLLGPVVSVATVFVLYSGFFAQAGDVRFGAMDRGSYLPFVVAGFLAHVYLNAGYYLLSTSVLQEWIGRTLPLIWTSTLPAGFHLLPLISVELVRAAVITAVAFGFLHVTGGLSVSAAACALLFLPPLLGFATLLGAIRSISFLLNEGRAEFLDHAYLFAVFGSCPYFPLEMLPPALHPFVRLNPLFPLVTELRNALVGNTPDAAALAWPAICAGALWLLLTVLWKRKRFDVMEHSIA